MTMILTPKLRRKTARKYRSTEPEMSPNSTQEEESEIKAVKEINHVLLL